MISTSSFPYSPNILMLPLDIKKKSENILVIAWDDGHESLYNLHGLREKCPCASCREARRSENEKLSSLKGAPQGLHLQQAEIVGRYALQFYWSDGHHEGIYTFDSLRKLCQCDKCISKE